MKIEWKRRNSRKSIYVTLYCRLINGGGGGKGPKQMSDGLASRDRKCAWKNGTDLSYKAVTTTRPHNKKKAPCQFVGIIHVRGWGCQPLPWQQGSALGLAKEPRQGWAHRCTAALTRIKMHQPVWLVAMLFGCSASDPSGSTVTSFSQCVGSSEIAENDFCWLLLNQLLIFKGQMWNTFFYYALQMSFCQK